MAEINPVVDNMNILLVEDDPLVRDRITQTLEILKYNVVGVSCARDAINKLQDQNNCFDLVMTDYSMPDMNGVELTVNLKRFLPDIPVILCTGDSTMTDEHIISELGVTEVLSKPFTTSELDFSLRRAIER